jgi:hypothetical protein
MLCEKKTNLEVEVGNILETKRSVNVSGLNPSSELG